MTIQTRNDRAKVRWRVAIVAIAPIVMLAGFAYHPWLGNPSDDHFLAELAAAVVADTTRWVLSHLTLAVGSGLLILAFLAIRGYLREVGEARWSALGVPFIVMGSLLYALVPAFEFAPLAAAKSGANIAGIQAIQAAQMPLFVPILLTSAVLFITGVLGFTIGIMRSRILGPGLAQLVAAALVVMAAARIFPVGAMHLYVGPVAGLIALWPLAYNMWTRREARGVGRLIAAQSGRVS